MKPRAVFQEGETVFFVFTGSSFIAELLKYIFRCLLVKSYQHRTPNHSVALAVTLTPFISPKDDPASMNSN